MALGRLIQVKAGVVKPKSVLVTASQVAGDAQLGIKGNVGMVAGFWGGKYMKGDMRSCFQCEASTSGEA